MTQTALERLKSLIGEGNYTEHGNGWINTRCPSRRHANGDSNPSLGLKEFASDQDPTETRISFHCFAGCSTEDILSGYGFNWKDLYSKPDGNLARELRRPYVHKVPTIRDLEEYVLLPGQCLLLQALI